MKELGIVLKSKTITIDEILLPMRNIARLQFEPSVSRALRLNTCQAQEPVSTRTATKHVVEILDAKYEKADLPAIQVPIPIQIRLVNQVATQVPIHLTTKVPTPVRTHLVDQITIKPKTRNDSRGRSYHAVRRHLWTLYVTK